MYKLDDRVPSWLSLNCIYCHFINYFTYFKNNWILVVKKVPHSVERCWGFEWQVPRESSMSCFWLFDHSFNENQQSLWREFSVTNCCSWRYAYSISCWYFSFFNLSILKTRTYEYSLVIVLPYFKIVINNIYY